METHTPYIDFKQAVPELENEYTNDQFLQDYLTAYLPKKYQDVVKKDLHRFGKRVVEEVQDLGNACDKNPPKLINFNAWGERIDEIQVRPEWHELRKIAAEEGLIAIGYERKFHEFSRLYQFVKLYLYTPSSAIYSCPLAMSDGAARLIEHYGDEKLKNKAFKGITSRNPANFLTSGQWMTERTGGSDVSRSMTLASLEKGQYILRGHKWFTSAVLANMAFTLASTEQPKNGTRAPLSLFYLKIRDENGKLNGIEVEALKDKMGTKALPTAQLKLIGTKAEMVGEKGKGVRTISTLFNVTRIYNTITACSYMRRAFAMAEAYGKIRETFGKKIDEHVLFQQSLRKLAIDYQSHSLLGFFLTQLLGKEDCKIATASEMSVLRILTPIAKLYTAKGAIASTSEEIEMFGGLGYLEDTNIPYLHRDAQVLSIWEGTTNVLSLDMLRAIEKENGLVALFALIKSLLDHSKNKKTTLQRKKIEQKVQFLQTKINTFSTPKEWERNARDLAFFLAELTISSLWVDFFEKNSNEDYLKALDYWLAFKMDEKMFENANLLN